MVDTFTINPLAQQPRQATSAIRPFFGYFPEIFGHATTSTSPPPVPCPTPAPPVTCPTPGPEKPAPPSVDSITGKCLHH